MLQALLRGKLSREQENMEDVLTSSVFGLLTYLPAETGLLPFVAHAEATDGTRPLTLVTEAVQRRQPQVACEFWPTWQEGGCLACEPDVVIRIDEPRWLIVVEAKYRSGKSSEADQQAEQPTDQLAREWDNLAGIAQSEHRRPYLIYLTSDFCCPTAEIQASVAECQAKRKHDPCILWLSWRHLHGLTGCAGSTALDDLHALTERLDLTFFRGISPMVPVQLDWRYGVLFDWLCLQRVVRVAWRFAHG